MKPRFFNFKLTPVSTRLLIGSLTLVFVVSVIGPGLAQRPTRRVFTATPLGPSGDVITKTEKDSPADRDRSNLAVRGLQEDSIQNLALQVQACLPPTVAIAPGSSPAGGYLPLALFGIPPIAGVGDDTLTNFTVPAFTFAGETWTSVGISSNGYVVIGGGSGPDNNINNQNFPDPARPNNVLALFWTDLNPAAAGAVRIGTLTDGSDTWIVVDWDGVREFSTAGNLHSFEVWIGVNSDANPGEDISYAYGPNTGNGDGGFLSVGAENLFGNSGQNTYFNGIGTLPTNGTQLRVTTMGHVVAKCKNISVNADDSCSAMISPSDVDDGSHGPNPGDPVTLSLDQTILTGIGDHTVVLTATGFGESCSCEATVTLVDVTAPTLTLKPDQSMFPPNHKYRMFTISNMVASVSDCDTSLGVGSVVIEKVTSDEPDNGNGDGDTANDIVIGADCKSVQLRSERDGSKNGRVYVVTLLVTDASGNATREEFRVSVPHSQNRTPAGEGPAVQTQMGTCP